MRIELAMGIKMQGIKSNNTPQEVNNCSDSLEAIKGHMWEGIWGLQFYFC